MASAGQKLADALRGMDKEPQRVLSGAEAAGLLLQRGKASGSLLQRASASRPVTSGAEAIRLLAQSRPWAAGPLVQAQLRTELSTSRPFPTLQPKPSQALSVEALDPQAQVLAAQVAVQQATQALQAVAQATAVAEATEPLLKAVEMVESVETPAPPKADPDEASWTEIFRMLQTADDDRGAQYALTIATLKRKGEDIQQQIDALQLAEGSLLNAAKDEAKVAVMKKKAEPRAPKLAKTVKSSEDWGRALASAVARQARDATTADIEEEPPNTATLLAQEAQQQVAETLFCHGKAQSEAQTQAVTQAEQALMLQAEAVAQAQVIAEAQATALSEVQAQAQAVAEMQLELQAEAQQAHEQQAELEAAAAERQALRAQGLNSKKLPLRPGVPPCSFFMRRGECKYGKTCKWDHPEAQLLTNSKGYAVRPGATPCPFYIKTGQCNLGGACKFDHPETGTNGATSEMQANMQALTQAAAAKVAELQASAGMHALADQEKQKQLLMLLGQ